MPLVRIRAIVLGRRVAWTVLVVLAPAALLGGEGADRYAAAWQREHDRIGQLHRREALAQRTPGRGAIDQRQVDASSLHN